MPSTISQMRNGQPQNSQQQFQQPVSDEQINYVKQLMRSANPTEALMAAISANPKLKQVIAMLQNGGNPQMVYENLARQRGVDPNWLINKLMK